MAAARACSLLVVLSSIALAVSAADAASAAVVMKDVQFQPASVTIDVGESVTWTNQDGQIGVSHSATADDGSFDTGVFLSGSRSVTFARAATIAYHCTVHPATMRGSVRVLGAATPAPTPMPTPPPTAPPTVAPTPPQTVATAVQTAARATTAPPPATPTPTDAPSPTPSATPTATPSPTPVAAQATVPPSPTSTVAATTTSRSDEGPGPLLIGAAVLGIAALAGIAVYVNRRP